MLAELVFEVFLEAMVQVFCEARESAEGDRDGLQILIETEDLPGATLHRRVFHGATGGWASR
jgi:hypothetical protein